MIVREREQVIRQQEQETPEQTGTRLRPEIRATTCEPLAGTRPKCTPTKEPELEVVPLTHLIRRIKCRTSRRRLRVIPKWARITLKWQGNIRLRQAAVIALIRAADNRNRKARKSPTNPNWRTATVKATLQTVTVTRRKVAGMEVAV